MEYNLKLPKGENKYLQVKVSYQKGGMNYYNYKVDRRGIYILFKEVEKTKGIESYMLGCGLKIMFKELKRKSAKQEKLVAEFLEKFKDELLPTYIKGGDKALGQFLLEKAQEYNEQ